MAKQQEAKKPTDNTIPRTKLTELSALQVIHDVLMQFDPSTRERMFLWLQSKFKP